MGLFSGTRRNPWKFGGINLKTAASLVGGLVGTALVNDRFVFPFVAKHLPASVVGALGSTQQRAVNGLTTLGIAIGGGIVLHDVDPQMVETAALGGAALGVGRIALAPIGGNLSVVVPGFGQTLAPQLASAQKALAGAQQQVATGTAAASAPVQGAGGFTGF